MDLRVYYQKIREMEQNLPNPCVVSSLETPDGGRAGVLVEVPAAVAARMIADRRAERASAEEMKRFQSEKARLVREAERRAIQQRLQVRVIEEKTE